MQFWDGVFLAIIQGITEFLPVSSSGHLAIFQIILKFKEPPVFFDLILHLATIFSIIFYYRKSLKKYINFKYISYIISGSSGTFLIAFPLKNFAEKTFSSISSISFFLFLTGLILIYTNSFKEKSKEIDLKKAFIIGLCQGIAIFPGISRSGITISSGIFLGLSPANACEFSFILSIPAISGANLLKFFEEKSNFFLNEKVFFPFLIAFFIGLISLNFTNKIFKNKNLKPFGIYCIILSVVILGAILYGKIL